MTRLSLDEAARVAAGMPAADEPEKTPLPATAVFEIDVTDKRGQRFSGRFEFHVPNLGDQMQIARIKSLLLPQGGVADPSGAALVDCLAYLQTAVRFGPNFPKPSWYAPEKAYSADPYFALYRRCLDYEAAFHGERPLDRGDQGGDRSGNEPGGGDGAAAVGRKVRPPTDRRETLAGDREGSA